MTLPSPLLMIDIKISIYKYIRATSYFTDKRIKAINSLEVKMGTYFIGFVGHSGSGKTTLIEKLITLFHKKGKVVGAIKHDAHSFEIDYPGKDSYRLKHAGAKKIVLSSIEKFALIEDRTYEVPLDNIKDMFSDCDIVFVEGYKLENIPKIEVHRKETDYEYLIESGVKNIIMVATDELERDFKVFAVDIDDIDSIANFIEKQASRG